MRASITVARLALVAGAAFAIAGCGSRPAANNTAANAAMIGNDLSLPMNDASAVETVSNASIMPVSNTGNSAGAETIAPPSGNTTVQSNIAGM